MFLLFYVVRSLYFCHLKNQNAIFLKIWLLAE